MLNNEDKIKVNVWETFTNQNQWKEYLQGLLKTDNQALVKALVLIYSLQTEEEKQSNESISENKVGFTKVDAKVLSDIARKFQKEKRISLKDLQIAKNKMPKYWKQLMNLSKKKIEEEKVIKENLNKIEKYEGIYEKINTFKKVNEDIIRCSEEGIPCDYGICQECILVKNYQYKLNLNRS